MDSPFAPRLRYKACQPLFPWCDGHLFPTPAVRPGGRALFFLGGPCLSGASWTALLYPAAVLSDEVGLGVNGFGSFCLHNKGCALRDAPSSPAGAKTGNTKNRLDTIVGLTDKTCSTSATFLGIEKTRTDSR
jgi:hypothetical protein